MRWVPLIFLGAGFAVFLIDLNLWYWRLPREQRRQLFDDFWQD